MSNLIRIRTAVMVVFLLLISVSFIQSQEPQTFRIDSYVPERFEDFGLRVGGDMQLYGSSLDNRQQYEDQDRRYDRSSSQLQFNASSQGSYRLLTRRYDIFASAYLSATYFDDHSELDDNSSNSYYLHNRLVEETDNSSYRVQVQPQIDALKYVSGDIFAGVSGYLSAIYEQTLDGDYTESRDRIREEWDGSRYSEIWNTDRSDYERSRSLYGSIAASMGYGRQYDGLHAAVAIAVVDELRSNGLLAQEPTYEQMLAFTDRVHYHFNRHAVDYRIYRIEMLTDLLAYLREQGVVGEIGNAGPFLLEDILLYYQRSARPFGTRVRGGFGADVEYYKNFGERHTVTDGKFYYYPPDSPLPGDSSLSHSDVRESWNLRSDAFYPFVLVQGEYAKPLSLKWQFDGEITGWAFFSGDKETDIERISYEDRFAVDAGAALTYIFNTRTYGSVSAQTNYLTSATTREVIATDSTIRGDTEHYLYYSLTGRLQYRISIPTSLGLQVQYWGMDRKNYDNGLLDGNQKSWSAVLSLTHWLF